MYGAIVLIVLAMIPSTPPTFSFRSLIILHISTVLVGRINIVFVFLTIGFTQTLLGCLIFLLKLCYVGIQTYSYFFQQLPMGCRRLPVFWPTPESALPD